MSTLFTVLVNGVFLVALSSNNLWWVFWAHRNFLNPFIPSSSVCQGNLSIPWFPQVFKIHPSSLSPNPLWFLLGYDTLCPKNLAPKSMNPYLKNTVLYFWSPEQGPPISNLAPVSTCQLILELLFSLISPCMFPVILGFNGRYWLDFPIK